MRAGHIAIGLLILLFLIGCESRSESYSWSYAPQVDDRGFQVKLLSYTESPGIIRARLCLRNLTHRDVILRNRPDDTSKPWISVESESIRSIGSSKQVVFDTKSEEELNLMENIPDGLTVRAHSSEYIESTFVFPDHLSSMDAAWTLILNGKWGFSDDIHLSLAVNRGPMAMPTGPSGPTTSTPANPDQAKAPH